MNDTVSNPDTTPAAPDAPAEQALDALPTEESSESPAFAPSDLVMPTLAPETAAPLAAEPPAPAPQVFTVEVDEATKALLSQQFVTLSSSVLDAADVASKAAKAANEAGQKFNHSTVRLTKLSQGMGKTPPLCWSQPPC